MSVPPPRVVAWDQMTAAERALFVRAVASATLRWALDDLARHPEDVDNETPATTERPRERVG